MSRNRRPPRTRRTVLLTAGSILAGAGLTTVFTGRSTAALSMDELTVEDSEYESEDGSAYTPWINITGSYSLETESPVDSWTITLEVGESGNSDWEQIGQTTGPALAQSMTGSFEVSGAVIDHSRWSPDDWTAPTGQTNTHTVPVRVRFEVENPDGVVASAMAEDSATLQVTSTGSVSDAFVQGEATVRWQGSESDPSPV